MTVVGNDIRGVNYGYTTAVPSSVHAGATFQATITLDPTVIPAQQQGYDLKGLVEAHHIIELPVGVTYLSASFIAGSGAPGFVTNSVSIAYFQNIHNSISYDWKGLIPGGTQGQLPSMVLTLRAPATGVSPLQFFKGGYNNTSYGTKIVTSVINLGQASTVCYPYPSGTNKGPLVELPFLP